MRRVDCHLSQESLPTSSPWLATLGRDNVKPNNRSKTQEQPTQPASTQTASPQKPRNSFFFFFFLQGGGGDGVANVRYQWHQHADSWASTQWVRTDTRSYLVLYWQHCVKHCKAKGTHNFHTMVMHKRFIPNIYIQIALTAKDELFHNLVCVPDCEVDRAILANRQTQEKKCPWLWSCKRWYEPFVQDPLWAWQLGWF